MKLDEIQKGAVLHYLYEARSGFKWREGGPEPVRFQATVLAVMKKLVRVEVVRTRRGVVIGTETTQVEPRKLIPIGAPLPSIEEFYGYSED